MEEKELTNENLTDIIAENLIYYRKMAGLTQMQLAEKLNYSDKSISKWERKEGVPDIVILATLAKIYGLTVNDFLTKEKKTKIGEFYFSKLLVAFIAVAGIEIVATILFALALIFKIASGMQWLVFIYSIPVISIMFIVFNGIFFKRTLNFFAISGLIWSLATSLFLSIDFENDYTMFIICIPVQVFLCLLYFLLYKAEKKKNKK